MPNGLWWKLSVIISCGTLAAAVIPEFAKIFTSSKSKQCEEVVTAAREGGASLDILSGLVAGNFSAFWLGMAIFGLCSSPTITSTMGLADFMIYPSVFAFGLVAFGMLGMGPVTIAVDSYGPVTDNAQSIYELSLIEIHSQCGKRKSRRTSALNRTLMTASSILRKMTAPATPSKPPPNRFLSVRPLSEPPP